jgi:outer membrane protein OmpA-like peptidoglycan-associated protein
MNNVIHKIFLLCTLGTLLALCTSFGTAVQQEYPLSTGNKTALRYYRKATTLLNQTECQTALKKAIAADATFSEAYWLLASYAFDRGDYASALSILRQADAPAMPYRGETQYRIAQTLLKMANYRAAIETLEAITDQHIIPAAKMLIERCRCVLALTENPVSFEPKFLSAVNTPLDNYFPSITADEQIISTTVSDRRSGYGEDLYWSRAVNGQWQPSVPLAELNTYGNEGSQSFSADGRYMFFVACNRPDGLGGCDIYYSIRSGDRWSRPVNAGRPLNSETWESNPALSPAGDELFFVTNRLPNIGKKDIWHCKVTILDNGLLSFANPKNLEKPVNTEQDDFAPFIHVDNQTLYFASNGHCGLGGSDIFLTRRTANGWSEPVNIGYPMNTNSDEFGFAVNAAGDKAYISSDKPDSLFGRLGIYETVLHPEARPQPMRFRTGHVYDALTMKPLEAPVQIYDTDRSETIFESQSDQSNGNFTVYLPTKGHYGMTVNKKGYLFYSANITATGDSLPVALHPIRRGQILTLNNLFFALNSSQITPASDRELKTLTALLLAHPDVHIEIAGHTDNTGTDGYNLTLSGQRALSVREALIARGIAPERLSAKGFGNTHPIAANDTEEGRRQNRRVECIVVSD